MKWFDDEAVICDSKYSSLTTIFNFMEIVRWKRGNAEIALDSLEWPRSLNNIVSRHVQFFEAGVFHSIYHLNGWSTNLDTLVSQLPKSGSDLLLGIVKENPGLEDFGNQVPSLNGVTLSDATLPGRELTVEEKRKRGGP